MDNVERKTFFALVSKLGLAGAILLKWRLGEIDCLSLLSFDELYAVHRKFNGEDKLLRDLCHEAMFERAETFAQWFSLYHMTTISQTDLANRFGRLAYEKVVALAVAFDHYLVGYRHEYISYGEFYRLSSRRVIELASTFDHWHAIGEDPFGRHRFFAIEKARSLACKFDDYRKLLSLLGRSGDDEAISCLKKMVDSATTFDQLHSILCLNPVRIVCTHPGLLRVDDCRKGVFDRMVEKAESLDQWVRVYTQSCGDLIAARKISELSAISAP